MECNRSSASWNDLSPASKLWIYTADRPLTAEEGVVVQSHMDAFINQWQAHGMPVRGGWALYLDRVLLLAADPAVQPPTGCSIDSSVAALRALGETLGCDWFNRHNIMYRLAHDPTWSHAQLHAFWALRKAGRVQDDAAVLATHAPDLGTWRAQPAEPFASSWHARMW
jgi:hypothetical protein